MLEDSGHAVDVEMEQPGYIRAIVRHRGQATKIEWAHDSAWRFLPPLAEPRDFLDVLYIHETILPLGPSHLTTGALAAYYRAF